jgi:GNAT superfamily N-acetyltransferase
MAKVRTAVESDVHEFAVLVKRFVKEAKYVITMDMDLVVKNFHEGLKNPEICWIVLEEDDEVVGFLAGATNSPLFSRDKIGVELGWYVHPEHRDGHSAIKLMVSFEQWCKKQRCKYITMCDIHTLQDLQPLYERRGYVLTEKSYMKEV